MRPRYQKIPAPKSAPDIEIIRTRFHSRYQQPPNNVPISSGILGYFWRRAVALAKGKYPFENHAWVVMPDHMHFVIRTHHVELGRFIGCFKSHMTHDFSQFSYKNYTLNNHYKWRRWAKRGRLWHLRFYDHRITDQQDYERCVKYCLYNPVKHGYTATAWDWPYSTMRSYIKQGKYPECWKYLTGQRYTRSV